MKKRFSITRLAALGVGLLAAGVLSFAFGGGSSSARADYYHDNEIKYYLTINGVDGDVDEIKHKDSIKLSSYRFLENQPDVEPMAAEDVAFGDNNLRFQAEASKASPMLFVMASTGQQVLDATLTVRKGWNSSYMTFKMTNLQVASYQNNSNEEHPPLDEVVMSFETLEISHAQDEQKPFKKGWDFKDKKPF